MRRAIEDAALVKICSELSPCWAATSGCIRDTVLKTDSSCEQEFPAAVELQENNENTGNEQ